jgi:outer membrane immunogenic protein
MATIASTGVMAADLGVRRPVPPPMVPVAPPVTWTGCYIGGNIGAAFGHVSVDTPFRSSSEDNTGFAGGGQVDCDYEFNGGWVIGIRDMFDGTTNHDSRTIAAGPLAGDVVDFDNQWFDTLTGRLGYSWIPNWLLYAQGGAAWAHTDSTITNPAGAQLLRRRVDIPTALVDVSRRQLHGPWHGITNGFTAPVCVAGCTINAKATEANVLVGVNYRF